MKIVILSFHSGIEQRGVERWVDALAARLSNAHEVTVYQNGPVSNSTSYKVNSLNIPYNKDKKEFTFPLQKKFFLDYRSRRIASFTFKLLPRIWKCDFDIIIPTSGGWEPAMVRVISWIKRKKMVVVGHAGIGWDDINNLWCFPDCFVALSTFAKSWAKKINPFVRSIYIPNGVDTRVFKPKGRKINFSLKRPVVLCAGALFKTKRIDLTIRAVAKINASLLVVGTGEMREELLSLGKDLLDDRFKMLIINSEKMPEVYRSATIFTIASISRHSFEMVLLEAMATNLPVVANKDPIREEIIGDSGFVVDPNDTSDYAHKLEEALKINWQNKPRNRAKMYSWNIIVRQYEKIFQELTKY